jgi:adenylate cyclase
LFTYVTLHFINHALGNVSLSWMERGLLVHKFIWQGVLGTAALYTALSVHFVLGPWSLYERRRRHWTIPELAQLLLGLSVPPRLANHLAVTRIAFATFDLNKGYAQELYSFWVASPFLGSVQLTLLVVAWLHGCMGLHFWLRLQPWYQRVKSWLLVGAVLLPVLALLGYFQAGQEVTALARDPVWRASAITPGIVGTAPENLWLANLRNGFLLFDGIALIVILVARVVRALHDRSRGASASGIPMDADPSFRAASACATRAASPASPLQTLATAADGVRFAASGCSRPSRCHRLRRRSAASWTVSGLIRQLCAWPANCVRSRIWW